MQPDEKQDLSATAESAATSCDYSHRGVPATPDVNSEMKTEAEAGQDDWLPSREQLVSFAVASQRKNPKDAVQYALAVWHEAGRVLVAKANAAKWRGLEHIQLPKEFPATLDEFLELVVKAKTPADATKRLRDYYAETFDAHPSKSDPELSAETYSVHTAKPATKPTPESWGASAIEGWKYWGFTCESTWFELAINYLGWWKKRKSIKSRESAGKRNQKQAN